MNWWAFVTGLTIGAAMGWMGAIVVIDAMGPR
jgi:hypothetical protein